MKINYIQKDIFEAFDNNEIDIIAHQCNCVSQGVSGFAYYFFDKFPKIANNHYEYIKKENVFATNLYDIVNNKLLVNMYSQYYPGGPSNNNFLHKNYTYIDNFHIRISGLKSCLKSILNLNFIKPDAVLGIPLVASGIGADNKLRKGITDLEYFKKYIESVILNSFNNTKITINVYYL